MLGATCLPRVLNPLLSRFNPVARERQALEAERLKQAAIDARTRWTRENLNRRVVSEDLLKHNAVLQKYAQKKKDLQTATAEASQHRQRADEATAKLATLERGVKVLEGQKDEEDQKYKSLVAELERLLLAQKR